MPTKAAALIPRIMHALGNTALGIKPPAIADARALIEKELMQSPNPADKLQGALLYAFMHQRFYAEDPNTLEQRLRTFVDGQYCYGAMDSNPRSGYTLLPYNEAGLIDHTAIADITTREWAKIPDYAPCASAAAGGFAFLIHQAQVNYPGWIEALSALPDALAKAHITPFTSIHITEFGGKKDNVLNRANVDALFGAYTIIADSTGAKRPHIIEPHTPGFAHIEYAEPLIPLRSTPYILASNVFAQGAVTEQPAKHSANLLCAMANAMPHGARLYIRNSYGDGIDFRTNVPLLALAGLEKTPATVPMQLQKHHGHQHYILTRNRNRQPNPVSVSAFTETWQQSQTPSSLRF